MGADIHMVLEKRSAEGKWIATDTFRIHSSRDRNFAVPVAQDRNYKRFAALAGVRGPGPTPRGLPLDASETTNFLSDEYGEDGHSHSWLPLKEAVEVFVETEYWRETDDVYAKKYPSSFFFGVEEETTDEYRLVFWFDN